MRLLAPLVTLALGGLVAGTVLLAQEAAPEMPRAAAEHATLKERVGTWDAAFKFHMGPGQTVEDKATMTYAMLGDFWVIGRYEGTFMGGPFHGQEMSTYDPETKQFVSYWIDSTGPMLTEMRGTWDEASRTMNMKSLQVDPMSGVKTLSKTVVKDKDTILYSMTPEGQTAATMEITYTRRK